MVRATDTGEDEYGNPVRSWADVGSYRARVEQRSREERVVDRDTLLSDWVAFVEPSADITGRDRLRLGELTFEVVGPPAGRKSPRGVHHLEVSLRHAVD